MLKVNESVDSNGNREKGVVRSISITLTGSGVSSMDGVFWFAIVLLISAIAVAIGMSLLPRQLAIGGLVLLVVGSFIFNRLRLRQKSQKSVYVSDGVLDVSRATIVHKSQGRSLRVIVKPTDYIEGIGTKLIIYDVYKQKKCQISGFENVKEIEVMKSVLQGKLLNKKHANITMGSS